MRKNTVKKILAALLAFGAISALTACNNSQTTAQSTAESSKSVSESSTESSKESSAESSSESSVESSKEVSESSAESSKESSKESSSESSAESSKAVSESSVESSKESSDESSEIPVYQVESKKASFKDVTRYGKILKTAKLTSKYGNVTLPKGYLVAILKVNDSTYDIYCVSFSITVDASLIELFDEDYEPDFSLRYWFGIDEEYLNL